MLRSVIAAIVFLVAGQNAIANEAGNRLASEIAARAANEGRVGEMVFRLESSSGSVRERRALMMHSDQGKTVQIAIYFTHPAAIADTAFLSHDHLEGTDENWLYLPATERVRRLPVSERGSNFMGSDLTYGDIKDNFKFGLDDWRFTHGGTDKTTGHEVLKGVARTSSVAEELGYGSFVAQIDPQTLFPVQIMYADTDGEALKRVEVLEQDRIGGAWTAIRFKVENLQTGHTTHVHFEGMRYYPGLDSKMFSSARLAAGVPLLN
jgi:hypothetical protein